MFEAIGTRWQIDSPAQFSGDTWTTVCAKIEARIAQFDRTYSRFRSDSSVCGWARHAGTYELPEDAYPLLQMYESLYRLTAGKMTPLVGRLMEQVGYDRDYSLQPGKPTAVPTWEEVVRYDTTTITLNRPVLLDFGAAGKGYLIDIIGEMLQRSSVDDFVINAGGDILHHGRDPVEIGLEHPSLNGQVIGTVKLKNASICASAPNRRHWGAYHHVMDPQTLASTVGTAATWVVAGDACTADGLATALFFASPAALRQEFDFACAVLDEAMGLTYSKDFPIQLFEAAV